MIYDILEEKLTEAGFVAGETLFRQFMPSEVSIGVMTRIPLEGIPEDANLPGYYKGRMQLIIRHIDPVEGRQMAKNVVGALRLQGVQNFPASAERGPAQLSLFYPESLPIEFPSLDSDSLEWSVHFKTSFTFSAL